MLVEFPAYRIECGSEVWSDIVQLCQVASLIQNLRPYDIAALIEELDGPAPACVDAQPCRCRTPGKPAVRNEP